MFCMLLAGCQLSSSLLKRIAGRSFDHGISVVLHAILKCNTLRSIAIHSKSNVILFRATRLFTKVLDEDALRQKLQSRDWHTRAAVVKELTNALQNASVSFNAPKAWTSSEDDPINLVDAPAVPQSPSQALFMYLSCLAAAIHALTALVTSP